jgi:EpsI family protein
MRELILLVPLFLAGQAVLVHWIASGERPPAPPALASFPSQIGPWTKVSEDIIPKDVRDQLQADQLLSRTYVRQADSSPANLLVAWFQTQNGGARQPHSPQVCLPGSGWIPQLTDEVALATAAGAITVNRYIVSNGAQRAVVLYWYQTPRRVIAGEWAAKWWLISDAIRDRRTDTALVRLITWVAPGQDASATASVAAFGQQVYPLLRESLPR